MLSIILKIIVATESMGLCYYLFRIAMITFAELSSIKSYKEIQDMKYKHTMESEKTASIVKNLKEVSHKGERR